jgi:hypothetical protein
MDSRSLVLPSKATRESDKEERKKKKKKKSKKKKKPSAKLESPLPGPDLIEPRERVEKTETNFGWLTFHKHSEKRGKKKKSLRPPKRPRSLFSPC